MTDATPDPRSLTDQLAAVITAHLREHLWNGPAVTFEGDQFEPLDEAQTAAASGDEFDVILRAPDGTLFDVEVGVDVAWRLDRQPVDLPAGVADAAAEAAAQTGFDSVQVFRDGIRYEVVGP